MRFIIESKCNESCLTSMNSLNQMKVLFIKLSTVFACYESATFINFHLFFIIILFQCVGKKEPTRYFKQNLIKCNKTKCRNKTYCGENLLEPNRLCAIILKY